jgi:hypothetical protein|tara:strand:- start:1077 stop:2528 length:1452 start_codon:yes stop_codon:yes gene_type:complete
MFFFQGNLHEIPFEDVTFPLFLSISITFLSWIILRKFIGGQRSGLILSLVIMSFINLGNIRFFISDNPEETLQSSVEGQILVSILLIINVIGIIYFLKKHRLDAKTSIANVISMTMIGVLIISITSFSITTANDNSFANLSNVPIQISDVENKPNIYFIILDEYAGFIQLKNDFNFDNSNFKSELEKRDFLVVKESLSNYPNTSLSIPSIINMIYFDFIPDKLGKDSKNIRVVEKMINENNVMKILQANGYKITTLDGAVGRTPDTYLADVRLCSSVFDINPDIRKNFALVYVPIVGLQELIFDEEIRKKLECSFSALIDFNEDTLNPDFVVAHLRFPHAPYIYDSSGNSISINDMGDQNAYLEQLKFANKKTLEIIDSIQERSSENIIIIISDHGFRYYINWENPTESDYIRGFNNLSAYYLPGEVKHETIAPVNIFRTIFNSYLGMDYEILDDRQIWYSMEKPFDHKDVTDLISDYLKNSS